MDGGGEGGVVRSTCVVRNARGEWYISRYFLCRLVIRSTWEVEARDFRVFCG